MIGIVLFLACGPICAWLEGIDWNKVKAQIWFNLQRLGRKLWTWDRTCRFNIPGQFWYGFQSSLQKMETIKGRTSQCLGWCMFFQGLLWIIWITLMEDAGSLCLSVLQGGFSLIVSSIQMWFFWFLVIWVTPWRSFPFGYSCLSQEFSLSSWLCREEWKPWILFNATSFVPKSHWVACIAWYKD
jgi:hypothetical protein